MAAGASVVFAAAFFAGAAFLAVAFAGVVFAVLVFLAVVLPAAATRVPVALAGTGTSTEMPSPLRWASRPLRWRGSTAAASAACRTCSGLIEPVTDPVSTSDTTAGWASTGAGILRAFEDTNTSRQKHEPKGNGARQDPLSSRAALLILPRWS